MKLIVSQQIFSKALSLSGKSLLAKANLPILSNLLIKAFKNKAEILSTNLETATKVVVEAKVETEGETTISGRTLLEFVSQLPEGEVTVEKLGEEVLVKTGGFRARFATIGAEEFPAIPKIEKGLRFEVDAKEFVQGTERVGFSAAQDEGRPILTGVLWEISANKLRMVATDGYRLSMQEIPVSGGPSIKIIVPAKALIEAAKIVSELGLGEESKVEIAVAENLSQISFKAGNVEFSSRLIEGEYPNWQKVIPGSFASRAIIGKEDFFKVVKVNSIFARESGNIVRLKLEGSSSGKSVLSISSNTANGGSSDSEIEVQLEGPGGEIAFNFRYILEALSVIEGEDVSFEMVESLNPGRLTGTAGKSKFFHIIMPVRLQN